MCDPGRHDTSNMLNHLSKCPRKFGSLANYPNQIVLTFQPSKSGDNLESVIHRFNVEACRKALVTFVTLDEQPFKVVKGESFKHLCRQLQPQFTILSRTTIARDCYQLYVDKKKA